MFKSLVLLLLCVILFKLIFTWLRKRRQLRKLINQIPGPKGKFLIGNVLEFLVSPEEIWIKIRRWGIEYYPIYKCWVNETPMINILSPDDMELIMSSTKHSAKSEMYELLHSWLGTGLLTSNGTKWQSRRKILTPAFHFNILQQFMGVFVEESELLVELLQKECQKPYTEVVPFVTQFTLHSICETAMGTRLERSDKRSQEYAEAIFRMGEYLLFRFTRPWIIPNAIFSLTSTYRKQKKTLDVIHSFTKSVIDNRKINFSELQLLESNQKISRKKRLAMLDLLISAKNSGQPIDDAGIREEVDTFMFEVGTGHDTTTACISFTLLLLACHPEVQEKVVDELKVFDKLNSTATMQDLQNLCYLERVIKESLRMYPSVPFISRVTDEELCTHSGYVIPSNTMLQLHIFDLHHNADLYPEPYKFDPDRFLPQNVKKRHPFAYIPFSAGPRNCIGQKFALLEIKTVLSAILRRFVLEPVDLPSDITMIVHLVAKTKNGIKIKFRERLIKSY